MQGEGRHPEVAPAATKQSGRPKSGAKSLPQRSTRRSARLRFGPGSSRISGKQRESERGHCIGGSMRFDAFSRGRASVVCQFGCWSVYVLGQPSSGVRVVFQKNIGLASRVS